jgi:serine/threonine protein kinase
MAHACGHCGNHHEAYVTVCPVTGARLGNASYTLVNEDEALVGSIVAERYHVRDILGQGSTGTVFAAEHLAFGRGAAMKVLRPRYTAPETVRHVFQGETRAALGITHPSLCEVFDIGTLPDGAPFFVMERLQGDTLASRLGRERFSAAAAVDLMMQLLSGMDAVHARQLLVRDLRPQNVFLAHRIGCRPIVKLLDVGLARLIPLARVQAEWDALRAVTSASDVTGLLSIPYYLSPERARGDHGIEPSSDIFVAAIILYEALTGQKPFAATSWQGLIQQIIGAQPLPLNVLRPDLPEELGSLLARALAANPRARPPSAREMQDELRNVFDGSRRGSASMRTAPVTPAPSAPRLDVTLAARADHVDEASADHPLRTAPPPRLIADLAIDVDMDADMEEPAATSRGSELTTLDLPDALKRLANEDEETATMALTPEIRARIDRMTKRGPAGPPSAVEDTSPPTRRLKPSGPR